MGKKRINQLLDQLKENQQADLQNAAAIYTVAQVAVAKLTEQTTEVAPQIASTPGRTLPSTSTVLTQAELKARYGSHRKCRQAAKQAGIVFHKNPSWAELAVALSHAPEIQAVVDNYLNDHARSGLPSFSVVVRVN